MCRAEEKAFHDKWPIENVTRSQMKQEERGKWKITNTDLQHFPEELRRDSLSAVVWLNVEVFDDGDRVVGVTRSFPAHRPFVQSVEEEDVADD